MSSTPVLNTTLEALTVISDYLDYPQMPMQLIRTFCYVAARDELPMSELGNLTGVSQAAVSRNVAQLGPGISRDKPGHSLLEAYEDLDDRRHKRVRLTDKGRKLLMEMETKVSPKMRAAMGLKPYNFDLNTARAHSHVHHILPETTPGQELDNVVMVSADVNSQALRLLDSLNLGDDIIEEIRRKLNTQQKQSHNVEH